MSTLQPCFTQHHCNGGNVWSMLQPSTGGADIFRWIFDYLDCRLSVGGAVQRRPDEVLHASLWREIKKQNKCCTLKLSQHLQYSHTSRELAKKQLTSGCFLEQQWAECSQIGPLLQACVSQRKSWLYLHVNVWGTPFNYRDVKYPSCPWEARWTSCELLIATVYLLMNPRLSLLLHCPLGGWSPALSPRVYVCVCV